MIFTSACAVARSHAGIGARVIDTLGPDDHDWTFYLERVNQEGAARKAKLLGDQTNSRWYPLRPPQLCGYHLILSTK
jgi:hypothetical protein